MHFFNPKSSS